MNIIEKCARGAKVASEDEVANASQQLVLVDKAIEKVNAVKQGLLGIEAHAVDPFSDRLSDLRQERNRLTRLSLYGAYPCVSLEALRLRNRSGWPSIALLSLDSPRVQFGIVGRSEYYGLRWRAQLQPGLPPVLAQCYKDVLLKLTVLAKKERKSAYVATEFAGVIPEATKKKIVEAKPHFKTIYIAAEATNWEVSTKRIPKPAPRNVDPLVLGFDGVSLWIIDHFDMTPVERYIKDEFCV